MAAPTNAAARLNNNLGDLEQQGWAAFLSGQNTDGTAFSLPVTATVTVDTGVIKAGTATLTNVSTADGLNHTLLAANTNRLGAAIFNDSTANLFVKFGATASSTSFTVKMSAGAYFELPVTAVYTGRIDAIPDASAGTARVTELSA